MCIALADRLQITPNLRELDLARRAKSSPRFSWQAKSNQSISIGLSAFHLFSQVD